ncbi:hypothetical protein COZ81_01065 [Candidatus Jorgensenbacteria bacterium CG_4_8_14_3_um_filter_38_10]|nr:MAG: hypothetical protein COZ81_01065 [Candidatus Jorgensenbacteria bacterium CG_4_8_14_3_um_filter_38_10]
MAATMSSNKSRNQNRKDGCKMDSAMQKKVLSQLKLRERSPLINAERLEGNTSNLSGDAFRIRGNVSGISGDVSKIWGNVSGIEGDVSKIGGDVSGIEGDVFEIIKILQETQKQVS